MSATYIAPAPSPVEETSWNQAVSSAGRDERLRIARELHDVIGYGFAAISVQAASAAHTLDSQPERAAAALRAIQAASAEALRELRAILGLLRDTADEQV